MASLPSATGNSDSATANKAQLKRPRRIRYDSPTTDPQQSPHWESLTHIEGDKLLGSLEELRDAFQESVQSTSRSKSSNQDTAEDLSLVPLWSAICGYCEALATHKDESKRYAIFPIPIDALRRLVQEEFVPFCQQLKHDLEDHEEEEKEDGKKSKSKSKSKQSKSKAAKAEAKEDDKSAKHRHIVRRVANAVWKRAQGKSKNVRDELHANSLYVCFRGSIDKRSLDCFGAAIVTIASLQYVLAGGSTTKSYLTLSEDHAYESHSIETEGESEEELGTCEMAIPGNTKDVQQTRGLDIKDALAKANKGKNLPYQVTPENSWLYMRSNAVVCRTIPMVLGAVIGNINCSIQASASSANQQHYFVSGPLMDLKRELLWVLHDNHHLRTFPFALMELGECEEHRSTARGLAWVDATVGSGIQDSDEGPVMMVEKLYLDAMSISRTLYGDSQAYPYFCAGHYHKDAVWEETTAAAAEGDDDGSVNHDQCQFNPDREYRLVESVRLYSEASRIASRYVYDLQLMKHMTKASKLILDDILTQDCNPREWSKANNAVAAGTWLIAFVDSLLLWEEQCGGKQFCEILTTNHPNGIGKLFQYLAKEVRHKVLEQIHPPAAAAAAVAAAQPKEDDTEAAAAEAAATAAITENNLLYFSKPRSKRLQPGSPLVVALLGKDKVVVREMELTIPMSDTGGRRGKRARRY